MKGYFFWKTFIFVTVGWSRECRCRCYPGVLLIYSVKILVMPVLQLITPIFSRPCPSIHVLYRNHIYYRSRNKNSKYHSGYLGNFNFPLIESSSGLRKLLLFIRSYFESRSLKLFIRIGACKLLYCPWCVQEVAVPKFVDDLIPKQWVWHSIFSPIWGWKQ